VQYRHAEFEHRGALRRRALRDDAGPGYVAGVLRSSSARLRSIKGTERCERRRAAIRALQQAVERFADATAFIPVRRTVDTEAEVDGELHWLFRVLAGE